MRFQIFVALMLLASVLGDPLIHRGDDENVENSLNWEQNDDGGLVYDPEEDDDDDEEIEDPCGELHCGAGKECLIDMEGEGYCKCVETCIEEDDERRMVCSNYNVTWPSDCQLYRMRCLCESEDAECPNKQLSHMHIDYYGKCQEVAVCGENEMADFPRRMREWLFNIMRDMADRRQLNERALELEREAELDDTKRWNNAAIWKWCEMDVQGTKDRAVSRHELFPLRAPLYTLEHCIAPFLDGCDGDNDHFLSLNEWTTCLQLSQDGVDDMEELCDEITE